MMYKNKLFDILFGIILTFQVLQACDSKDSIKDKSIDEFNNKNDLTISFKYLPEGGKEILKFGKMNDQNISIKENQESIEIDVYKWSGVPIDGFNGGCELKSDTLYLYYWEETKEANRNNDHASLILQSQFSYKIKKMKFKSVEVKMLDIKYIL